MEIKKSKIRVESECPTCGEKLYFSPFNDHMANKLFKCPKCGDALEIDDRECVCQVRANIPLGEKIGRE